MDDTDRDLLPDGLARPQVDPAALRTNATAVAEPGSGTDAELSLSDSFLLDEPD